MDRNYDLASSSRNISLQRAYVKRNKIYSEILLSENVWTLIIQRISISFEIEKKVSLFAEVFNSDSRVVKIENETPASTITRIIENWRKCMPQIGCIPLLIAYLRLLKFNSTADTVATVVTGDGKSVQSGISLTNMNNFCGRQKEVNEILLKIMTDLNFRDKSNSSQILITGPFGVGKSELARYIATTFNELFHANVIWIKAENQSSMRQSFLQLADKLGIHPLDTSDDERDITQECYEHFEWTHSLWIFENATCIIGDDGIEKFLPSKIRPKIPVILITSRNQEFPKTFFHHICLETLKEEDAIDLLAEELKIDKTYPRYEELKTLAVELGNFTLLLNKVSAYIKNDWKEKSLSGPQLQPPIQHFLEKYRKDDFNIKSEILFTNNEWNTHRFKLLKFFKVILNDLLELEQKPELIPQDSSTYKVLGLIGFGSKDHLPENLFSNLNQENPSEVSKLLLILLEQNIIGANAKPNGTNYFVQGDVQSLIQILLGHNGKLIFSASVPLVISKYLSSILDKFEFKYIQQLRDCLPTIESIHQYLLKFNLFNENGDFSSEFASCQHACYLKLDYKEESHEYAKSVLNILRKFYGENDRSIISMKLCLAQSVGALNQIAEARVVASSSTSNQVSASRSNQESCNTFQCEFCSKLLKTRRIYGQHIKKVHRDKANNFIPRPQYPCIKCGKMFYDKYDFRRHFKGKKHTRLYGPCLDLLDSSDN